MSENVYLRIVPWRLGLRKTGNLPGDLLAFDDVLGLVVALVLLALCLFGFLIFPAVIFLAEVVALGLTLPVTYLLRLCRVLRWPVVSRDGAGRVVAVEKIRGLGPARRRRDELRGLTRRGGVLVPR